MTESSIRVLPQTANDVLCVAYEGIVRADDYMTYFDKPLHALVKTYGTYRLLIHFTESFAGWDPVAADANFKTINEVASKAERLAYVNPPERKILQVSLQRFMWPGEVRFFDDDALPQALAWIQDKS